MHRDRELFLSPATGEEAGKEFPGGASQAASGENNLNNRKLFPRVSRYEKPPSMGLNVNMTRLSG
jgi:hypothetical protein